MPKDTSHSLRSSRPKPLPKALELPRQPRVHKELPTAVFDRIQHGRDTEQPYRYTLKDVKAIVSFVSRPPTTQGLTTIPDAVYDNKFARAKQFADRFKRERAAKPLAERLDKPRLINRISKPATYTPIAPKPLLFDFDKLTTDDLKRICRAKLDTILTRLTVVFTLRKGDKTLFLNDLPIGQKRTLETFGGKLNTLHHTLEEIAEYIERDQWTQIDQCFKNIGLIQFNSIRRRYRYIAQELESVAGCYCLDWIH